MVGITTRVALTAYRTDEGRNAADFFHGQATDVIVNNDKVRKGLLIGAIVIFVPMAICAFFVEPSNKSEEYLPSDHPLQKIVTIMSNEFPPAQWDRMVKAEIVFGINPAAGPQGEERPDGLRAPSRLPQPRKLAGAYGSCKAAGKLAAPA